jgi:hypothetical protein
MKKERRIGGSVLRPVPGNCFDVTGISDYGGVFLERFKQRHRHLLFIKLDGHTLLEEACWASSAVT